jgi:hypothetical protein
MALRDKPKGWGEPTSSCDRAPSDRSHDHFQRGKPSPRIRPSLSRNIRLHRAYQPHADEQGLCCLVWDCISSRTVLSVTLSSREPGLGHTPTFRSKFVCHGTELFRSGVAMKLAESTAIADEHNVYLAQDIVERAVVQPKDVVDRKTVSLHISRKDARSSIRRVSCRQNLTQSLLARKSAQFKSDAGPRRLESLPRNSANV